MVGIALRQATEGLLETANIIALTILGFASFLTADPWLIGAGCAIDVCYLFWASRSKSYAIRVGARRARNPQGVENLDRCLLFVSVAGIVVILFFGFGKHLLSHRWPHLTHASGWEAGAIGWTALFFFYYAVKFVEGGKNFAMALVFVVTFFICAPLLYLAWTSIGRGIPGTHITYVFLIGLCFFFLDLLLSTPKNLNAKERALSRASFRWADVPMVVAFTLLGLYLWIHPDAENKDVFVSGVISCQLVISNVVFVVMEFGLLRPMEAQGAQSALLEPSRLTAKAPEIFQARFETSKGVFVIEVNRAWSPHGADRFFNLVSSGYYDEVRFFRVIAGLAQFGIHGNPNVNQAWQAFVIEDDPVLQSNTRGMVSFVMRGPGRTTQVFINYSDENARFDHIGFSPFGRVIVGMDVLDNLHSAYGEGPPNGTGPDQNRIQLEGNAYLISEFSKLDYIKSARVVATSEAVREWRDSNQQQSPA